MSEQLVLAEGPCVGVWGQVPHLAPSSKGRYEGELRALTHPWGTAGSEDRRRPRASTEGSGAINGADRDLPTLAALLGKASLLGFSRAVSPATPLGADCGNPTLGSPGKGGNQRPSAGRDTPRQGGRKEQKQKGSEVFPECSSAPGCASQEPGWRLYFQPRNRSRNKKM